MFLVYQYRLVWLACGGGYQATSCEPLHAAVWEERIHAKRDTTFVPQRLAAPETVGSF